MTIQDDTTKLRKGLNKAADIITSSMGSKGRTVIINTPKGLHITKDGVSIARSIKLNDPQEDVGAQLLISAAQQTVKETGDSTTLTSLMLQQMVNHTKTIDDYYELEKETNELIDYINDNKKEVSDIKQITQIAKTSSNSEEIANLFKRIYEQTSFDTHINLEKTEEKNTTITIDKGFRFESGFNHDYQQTDDSKQVVEYDNPNFYIQREAFHLITEPIKQAVRAVINSGEPLVFIGEKYSKEFDRWVHRQVTQARAKILTLKIPNYGQGKEEEYQNIKSYLSDVYTTDKIVSTPYYTILYNEDKPNLEQRLIKLKSLSQEVQDPLEANMYKKMYYTLSGNIATIWVGGNTEEARDEFYDRVEDTVGATQTAIKHGYTIGMGKIFYNFSHKAKYKDIWQSPYNTIVKNAHLTPGIVDTENNSMGLNLNDNTLINLYKEGIIDPTHTLITALTNALTNTRLVLNTKYILHND